MSEGHLFCLTIITPPLPHWWWQWLCMMCKCITAIITTLTSFALPLAHWFKVQPWAIFSPTVHLHIYILVSIICVHHGTSGSLTLLFGLIKHQCSRQCPVAEPAVQQTPAFIPASVKIIELALLSQILDMSHIYIHNYLLYCISPLPTPPFWAYSNQLISRHFFSIFHLHILCCYACRHCKWIMVYHQPQYTHCKHSWQRHKLYCLSM